MNEPQLPENFGQSTEDADVEGMFHDYALDSYFGVGRGRLGAWKHPLRLVSSSALGRECGISCQRFFSTPSTYTIATFGPGFQAAWPQS